jgi:AraC-like DNA-binding protein
MRTLSNALFVKHSFKKQSFKKHFHTDYSIGLITQGVHKLKIEKEELITTSGVIKIINPYQLHIADGNISWEYINFMPSKLEIATLAREICDDEVAGEIIFQNRIEDSRANGYFLRLFKSVGNTLEYEENLIIFLSYLLKNYSSKKIKTKHPPANIKRALEYIHESFLEDISLESIAKVSNLSKYHFLKLFSKEMGLTPYQYIIDLRLSYGVKLIKENFPLSQVALEAGFSDQSHFIKTFKKYNGYTPSLLK